MAESFIQLNNDGPGKQVDTWTEATTGHHRQAMVIADPSITANVASVTAAKALTVDGSAVTQPVSLSGNVMVVQPTGTNLHTVVDSGTITLSGTSSVSGTVTANAGTGTFAISAASLPLPAGASTAANQTSVIGSASGGTASASSLLSGGQFNTVLPTLTNTQQAAIQLDSSARVIIAPLTSASTVTVVQPTAANLNATIVGTVTANQGTPNTAANAWPHKIVDSGGVNTATVNAGGEVLTTDTDLTIAQGSTITGALGPLVQGSVTTAAPAYTTAQVSPLSLNTAGGLRVDGSGVTQPVSGTVTANQGTANATPWNENIAQIAGTVTSTAAAGTQKVGISGSTAAALDGVITVATAPANGLAILTVAQTTAPSLTAGQSVAVQCDYAGSAFVKPYRRSQVVSQATTIAASTAATTVLAAQGAGIFADISNLMVTTTPAATTSTAYTITLSDGTKSYIYDLTQGLATAAGEDQVNINFNPPLPATTANTVWTITNSTTTPTNHITVVAVLQKAS